MTETKIHVFIGAVKITETSIVFFLHADLFSGNGNILY